MTVSVLVPSYNHAKFVEKTLLSIFKQTLKPKKLIVIDDGSKDESAKVIQKVLQNCPFPAELIVRENRGLCTTLNEGFSLTDSKYFAYISSDDLWLPNFLESRVKLLENRPSACLSYGHALLIDENDQIIDSTSTWSDYADGNALEMLLFPIIPMSASVVYRREILKNFLWNKDSILEDYELYLQLSAKYEFALGEKNLSAWRIHGYNTSADFTLMMNEWLEAQNRQADKLGITTEKLAQVQATIKFRCVKDYLRRGQKQTAWRLFRENLYASPSVAETANIFFRFLVPFNLLKIKRLWQKNQTVKKFGKLEI